MPTNYIDRLVVELLREIFVQCVTVKGVIHPLTAPLLLCQVCSDWRAIAIGFPELWHTLIVELPNTASDKACVSGGSIARFWLENAGNSSPLSFSLRYQQRSHAPLRSLSLLDDIIASHSSRYRNLELRLRSNTGLRRFFSLPRGSLPLLECLVLDVDGLDQATRVFWDAPRLRKLTLPAQCLVPLRLTNLFPWSQLTHLTMSGMADYRAWRMMFSQCILLEYCYFCILFKPSERLGDLITPNGNNPIVFKDLTTLKLAEMNIENLYLFHHGFTFPALTNLYVRDSDFFNEMDLIALEDKLFLDNLRHLSLRHNVMFILDILNIVITTNGLLDLELSLDENFSPSDIENIYEELTCSELMDSTDEILPKLEILTLRLDSNSHKSPSLIDSLCTMIESRWRGRLLDGDSFASLRVVTLKFYPVNVNGRAVAEEVIARLEPCRIEGLDLRVKVIHPDDDEDNGDDV